ncbi:Alkaline phytoceramidase (aPHC) [Quillaja saponaria]|uniref:Alkaline phytoceramidase (APHC) n=1 Tax=Quillaja saponaria TaxID=32244 RepID=A0AAD7LY28_QUISA|nr:Alkaline phytoceramidase (aPHC) [Quillaja saponaria]
MGWVAKQLLGNWKRTRITGGAFLCCVCLFLATPKIPRSPKHHLFADMRNLLGGLFSISLRGEFWGWALYYAGMAGVAFGSAYYHLKPDDSRVMWDTLPMMLAYSSLFSSLLIERLGQRIGMSSLFALLLAAFLCMAYERSYDDIRLCMIFQLIPSIAIPSVAFLFRPKYSHSRYWLWSSGIYLLAKFEAAADRKIYRANSYLISGHSLGHLCLAVNPILLSIMLFYRDIKAQRIGDLKEEP